MKSKFFVYIDFESVYYLSSIIVNLIINFIKVKDEMDKEHY